MRCAQVLLKTGARPCMHVAAMRLHHAHRTGLKGAACGFYSGAGAPRACRQPGGRQRRACTRMPSAACGVAATRSGTATASSPPSASSGAHGTCQCTTGSCARRTRPRGAPARARRAPSSHALRSEHSSTSWRCHDAQRRGSRQPVERAERETRNSGPHLARAGAQRGRVRRAQDPVLHKQGPGAPELADGVCVPAILCAAPALSVCTGRFLKSARPG